MLLALLLQVWAEDPGLQRAAALAVDGRGRVYVAEFGGAAEAVDFWVDAARRTVADRPKSVGKTTLRRFEDVDGDSRAEAATVFAEIEGTPGGLFGLGDEIWFAGEPTLWVLRDPARKPMFTGFGVHAGPGLGSPRQGPDGKIYVASGDAGFSVVTQEGDRLEYPDMGAVLRFDADGSNLEVYAIGLRAPRDAAFDDLGELFVWEPATGLGDQARWVHVPEGSDHGWRRGFHHASEAWGAPAPGAPAPGPGRNGVWATERTGMSTALPPVALLGMDPPILAFCPVRNRFFASGSSSFALTPKGAGYEITEEVAGTSLATDAEFGPDGALYVLEAGKGRILRVPPAEEVAETRALLREGMKDRAPEALATLMGHRDQRVRRTAQQELVGRQGSTKILGETAKASTNRMARIHAIWGLGQLYTRNALFPLLKDRDPEIRAQTARVLGDRRVGDAHDGLLQALKDESPRVRRFAATALGKIGRKEAARPLAALLRENDDRDPVLRHAATHALALIGGGSTLQELAKDGSRAVRLASLLAMRRLARADVDNFLDDPELAVEAARAIHDLPIQAVLPRLAAKLGKSGFPEAGRLRALNANFRLGLAEPIASFAAKADAPEALRVEALRALAAWAKPSPRDRVTGAWRPLPERDPAPAREALGKQLEALRKDASASIRAEAEAAARVLTN